MRRSPKSTAGAFWRGRARSVLLVGAAAVTLVALQPGTALSAPMTGSLDAGRAQLRLSAAQVARLSDDSDRPVIVFMKDQPAIAPVHSAAVAARSVIIAADQRRLVIELSRVHARHIIAYRLVNAVAATVSSGEEAWLEADPSVQKVIPDATIQGPSLPAELTTPAETGSTVRALPGACLSRGRVQLEPEALALTGTQSLSAHARTARSLGFTGAGVTVGFLADGVDPDNINFIRKDRKSVFARYVDFSGDGTAAVTDGGEAFLDANSIAGQGIYVYNVQHFGAQSLPTPCDIRIEGVAPGVSLVGLKIFSQDNYTTTSAVLDAINYATVVYPVNVLNESFGSNGIPGSSVDAIDEFDNAAVAAGITVVTGSGDAGPTNTIATPATDPEVLSVGASTDFRFYAMTDFYNADLFASRGWLDDNISALSSGGYDETGRTVDLVAPGDSSFGSCSTAKERGVQVFQDCKNFKGQPSAVERIGGSSQAAPLTAGAAALVIQAYRKTHGGATPSPALVREIILSTATDLGAPADEQGAGLLNTYKAVLAAESVRTAAGRPQATGSTLLTSTNQINEVADPGTSERAVVAITNAGTTAQTVRVSGRSLGLETEVQQTTVILSDAHSKHFSDFRGYPNNYEEVHFDVRKDQNRLDASISFPGNPDAGLSAEVDLILIDPEGRFAGNSAPQGLSNYGNVDVIDPAPGRWTAVISALEDVSPYYGTTGKVVFQATVQKFAAFGSVSPPKLTIPAGNTATFRFTVTTPSLPGDADGSLVLKSGSGTTSIPVTLRSYIDASAGTPGAFSGVLTNGNGRSAGEGLAIGQYDYYEFRIPVGTPAVSATFSLANDPADPVYGYLADPDGQIQGSGSNYVGTSGNQIIVTIAPEREMTVYAVNPVPGIWTLIIGFGQPGAGNEIADPFTGQIAFTSCLTVTDGLPDSTATTLSAPTAYTVAITNNCPAPEDFFVDPRLSATSAQVLVSLTGYGDAPVPLPGGDLPPVWLVPTQVTSLSTTATAEQPITFDVSPILGDPDIFSGLPASDAPAVTVSASDPVAGDTVTAGAWVAFPALAGTDGFTVPPVSGTVNTMTMTATMNKFDPSVTSNIGDPWQSSVSAGNQYSLFEILPRQQGTITVTITPSQAGVAGTVVRGTLYIDDLVPTDGRDGGSEAQAIPYSYTAGS
jgi:hypothetical protein